MPKKSNLYAYFFQKMSVYRRDFDETKFMSFLVKDHGFLEKYNEIWTKVSNSIKNTFNSEPVYNEKYLNTKLKSYKKKINTNYNL